MKGKQTTENTRSYIILVKVNQVAFIKQTLQLSPGSVRYACCRIIIHACEEYVKLRHRVFMIPGKLKVK